MTSITLPLKRIPGQTQQAPTFFGGRSLVAPMILLFTAPFTLYLYCHLNYNSLLSYNLLSLLPYFWGGILIADWVKKSSDSVKELFEADLNDAKQIFDKNKNYFRRVLVLYATFSIITIIIYSYSLILFKNPSLFIISLISIISIEFALASIMSQSNIKRVFSCICLVGASETAFIFITFKGLWIFNLIFLVVSFLHSLLCLNKIDKYDLRSFFERMIS